MVISRGEMNSSEAVAGVVLTCLSWIESVETPPPSANDVLFEAVISTNESTCSASIRLTLGCSRFTFVCFCAKYSVEELIAQSKRSRDLRNRP